MAIVKALTGIPKTGGAGRPVHANWDPGDTLANPDNLPLALATDAMKLLGTAGAYVGGSGVGEWTVLNWTWPADTRLLRLRVDVSDEVYVPVGAGNSLIDVAAGNLLNQYNAICAAYPAARSYVSWNTVVNPPSGIIWQIASIMDAYLVSYNAGIRNLVINGRRYQVNGTAIFAVCGEAWG